MEPEPIFCWPEPRAEATFFKAAPAASFCQAKKESLVVVTKHDFRAILKVNVIQKILALIIQVLRAQNEKC